MLQYYAFECEIIKLDDRVEVEGVNIKFSIESEKDFMSKSVNFSGIKYIYINYFCST